MSDSETRNEAEPTSTTLVEPVTETALKNVDEQHPDPPKSTKSEPTNPLTSSDQVPSPPEEKIEEHSSSISSETIPLKEESSDSKPLLQSKKLDESIDSEKDLELCSSQADEKLDDATQKSHQQETKSSSNESERTQSTDQYAEHVTYTDDGTAIYIDPKTQHKYKWCPTKNNWISFDNNDNTDNGENTNPIANDNENKKSNPYENEHYRWCSKTNQWIPKNTATEQLQATSQTETEHYRWDAEKNEWILKNQVPSLDDVTYGYEDGVRIYTDKDGMVFFWDTDKKAWFPKIDDDFLAKYQMSYGFIDNTTVPAPASTMAVDENKIELERKTEEIKKNDVAAGGGGLKRKAPPEPPKWFEIDETQNTKVYVSNLPLDITLEEFSEIMSKCGMIMKDPQTQKQKLKLYAEPDGQLKGDGLCDYIKVESVDLALNLLDESVIRGNKIKVQRAKFQMRGEYNPSLKPKRKKKDKEKLIKMKEKLFDWRPEKMRGERSKHERTVIIKNLFTPELFDKEVQLIIEYQNDLREECSKCGTVRKVVVYDRHPEGVAQVNMADPEQADLVIQMMNGRFFGQRKLTAETWDGKTKYKIAETEEEIKARINKWDKYLEKGEAKEEESDNEDDDDKKDESTKIESTVDGKTDLVQTT